MEFDWSYSTKIAIAIVPKFSSFMSICGSSYIIHKSIRHLTRRAGNLQFVRHRLLTALSFCDLIGSCGYFMSTWAIPSDIEFQSSVVFNIGNQTTCNVQGFMVEMGALGTAFYNTSLSIYFLLSVRYGMKDEKIKKSIEPIFHVVSIGFPLSIGIVGVVKQCMNPTLFNCWIVSYPANCVGDECIRGGEYMKLMITGLLVPITLCILILTLSMVFLYKTVKEKEEAIRAYSSRWVRRPAEMQSRKVLLQAIRYIFAFYTVWIPVIIHIFVSRTFLDRQGFTYICTGTLLLIFAPGQGFFNCLVYMKYNPVENLIYIARQSLRRVSFGEGYRTRNSQTVSRIDGVREAPNTFDERPNSGEDSSPKYHENITNEQIINSDEDSSSKYHENITDELITDFDSKETARPGSS